LEELGIVADKSMSTVRRGIWNSIDDPLLLNLVTKNLDFVIIDLEHGYRDVSKTISMVLSLAHVPEIFVRLRSYSDPLIQTLLDIGVSKFIVPQIRTALEIDSLTARVTLPPKGSRGVHPRQRVQHDKQESLIAELYPIIETLEGLSIASNLIARPEVGGLYFGSYDLAQNLSLAGPLDEKISQHMLEVSHLCSNQSKRFIAMPLNDKQRMACLSNKNSDLVIGIDTQLLHEKIASIIRGT
jgi:2-keto-3-deoxy-L-rhamnonate aldolase RhmA